MRFFLIFQFYFPYKVTRCRLGEFDMIFVSMLFNVEHKLYVTSGSTPPQRKVLGTP